MHELGHNLGLAHSGESTVEYGDQSGMMGYSYSQDEGPVMCFNTAKNWQLGWYPNARQSIKPLDNESFSGHLIGISDYGATTDNVMIQITGYASLDYYVAFNQKSGINSGTVEGGNQVLVHSRIPGIDYKVSILEAKLSSGGIYTITGAEGTTTITINSIDLIASPPFADITITPPAITVSPTFAPSTSPPTNPPTNAPTNIPTSPPTATAGPTNVPTAPIPTFAPTNALTNSPTLLPTTGPTNVPTLPPTNIPTAPPTMGPPNVPTLSPTNSPTSPPTLTPTYNPTAPCATVGASCNTNSECCGRGRCHKKFLTCR